MAETANAKESNENYLEYVGELKRDDDVATDEVLAKNDNFHMMEHNSDYTKLLGCYVENLSKTLKAKYWFKIIFFGFIMFAIIIVLDIFMRSINYALQCEEMSAAIVAIIGGFVSLISATIALPSIIAQYLFNIDEEKDASEIIKNMQEFDKIIRKRDERES